MYGSWNTLSPSIYSLIFGLSSEAGHLFHYHKHLQRVCCRIGWGFKALIPMETRLPFVPRHWQAVLATDPWDQNKTLADRLLSFFKNIQNLSKIFNSLSKQSNSVVFLESFEIQQLGSLLISITLKRNPKFEFWLLHRYDYGPNHYKTILYRVFHWILEIKLGKRNVQYLTDSELLAASQQRAFHRPVKVLPIPHSFVRKSDKLQNSHCYFWWPGSTISNERGLQEVLVLAKSLANSEKYCLLLTERAKKFFTENARLHFLPAELTRSEYEKWMLKTDFVLLPYSSEEYARRTSGIFIEAICAGAIPVTKDGTWMAYELRKFRLDALILNWEKSLLLDQFNQIHKNSEIQSKLKKLQAFYHSFHSEEGYAKVFQSLYRNKP